MIIGSVMIGTTQYNPSVSAIKSDVQSKYDVPKTKLENPKIQTTVINVENATLNGTIIDWNEIPVIIMTIMNKIATIIGKYLKQTTTASEISTVNNYDKILLVL